MRYQFVYQICPPRPVLAFFFFFISTTLGKRTLDSYSLNYFLSSKNRRTRRGKKTPKKLDYVDFFSALLKRLPWIRDIITIRHVRDAKAILFEPLLHTGRSTESKKLRERNQIIYHLIEVVVARSYRLDNVLRYPQFSVQAKQPDIRKEKDTCY